jgi:hypothetical protein
MKNPADREEGNKEKKKAKERTKMEWKEKPNHFSSSMHEFLMQNSSFQLKFIHITTLFNSL